MNNKESFELQIYKNWADRFGCSTDLFPHFGTSLIPGDENVSLFHIGNHTIAQYDPRYAVLMQDLTHDLPAGTSLSADILQSVLGSGVIQSRSDGLIFYLYPPDLVKLAPLSGFNLRQLTLADTDVMADLHAACTPPENDEGEVEVTHEIAFGSFMGKQLVAAASGYTLTGFMDIGVLTHPSFRHKGLGKAVVNALSVWIVQSGLIAQYRCDPHNQGSKATAQSLHFTYSFKEETFEINS